MARPQIGSFGRYALACAAIAAAALPAGAEPLAIAWQVPAGCPEVASVRARIAQRVGAGDAYFGGMSVAVAVERVDGAYVAHIDLGGLGIAGGLRSLTSARCDEIADAVAVIVASIASGRHRVETGIATEDLRGWPDSKGDGDDDGDDGGALSRAQGTPTAPTRAAAAIARAPVAWRFGGRVSMLGGVGTAPGLSAGGEVVAFAQRGAAMIELGGAYWPVTGDAGRVTFARAAASGRLGWRSPTLPLRLWAVADVGSLAASDRTIDVQRTDSGRTVGVGAGAAGAWPMTSMLSLVVAAEQLVAVERLSFVGGDGMPIYAGSRAETRVSLGIEAGW